MHIDQFEINTSLAMKRTYRLILSLLLISILVPDCMNSQVVSQFRGKDRNGQYDETGLLREWPEEGPELLWSVNEIGTGYSSAIVANNKVYITGMVESKDVVTALDLQGNVLWQTPYGNGWIYSYPGTRGSATVEGDKVYAISGNGDVSCLDAGTGETIWSVNGFGKFDGQCTMWGVSESPLIVDNKVIYIPGGMRTTMVALNKETGKTIWESESLGDSTAYVSPLLFEHNGNKIIASITANYFYGIDPNKGKLLWKYKYYNLKWNQEHYYTPIINCNTPLYYEGRIFITKGYDHLAAMFALNNKGNKIDLLWTSKVFDVHHGGMVLLDGYLYGSNWLNNSTGNWCCIDWETGDVQYETKWNGKGSIITADGMLYCYDEKRGELALVEPTPEEFKIISSFRINKGTGAHWSHPLINNGILYVRHGDFLMAYDISTNGQINDEL